jgi:hypothetical protein
MAGGTYGTAWWLSTIAFTTHYRVLRDTIYSATIKVEGKCDRVAGQTLISPIGTAPDTPLQILEATLARRVSVISRHIFDVMEPSDWEETHIVVVLKLQGMNEMGYVYAYDSEDNEASPGFGNISVGGLKTRAFKMR